MAVAHFGQLRALRIRSRLHGGEPPPPRHQDHAPHYSAEVLFSPAARQSFVQPDVQSIPEHG